MPKKTLHHDVRVAFTLGDGNYEVLLKVATRWAVLLGAQNASGSKRICVWAANHSLAYEGATRIPWLCWHDVAVPESIDRYSRVRRRSDAWSPWGLKSGPNYQFFQVLDRSPLCHEETWLLLLELDTFPLNDPPGSVADLISANPSSWMIGARPHPSAEIHLDSSIRGHLNGSALYNVKSLAFSQFRRLVWIPSLLEGIRQRDTLAFDCLTSPAYWETLSPELRSAWRGAEHNFIASPGLVNLSNVVVTHLNIQNHLNLARPETNALIRAPHPWLLHAKTDDVDRLLQCLARRTVS